MVAESENGNRRGEFRLCGFGYYTPCIVLFNNSIDHLMENAEYVRRAIQAEGFGARIETLMQQRPFSAACLATGPAMSAIPDPHTEPFRSRALEFGMDRAGNAPCLSIQRDHHPDAGCVGLHALPLQLHVDDVGHTLIFGPTGSGKSTLLALIAAQFRRYRDAQIFAFDKGMSLCH